MCQTVAKIKKLIFVYKDVYIKKFKNSSQFIIFYVQFLKAYYFSQK